MAAETRLGAGGCIESARPSVKTKSKGRARRPGLAGQPDGHGWMECSKQDGTKSPWPAKYGFCLVCPLIRRILGETRRANQGRRSGPWHAWPVGELRGFNKATLLGASPRPILSRQRRGRTTLRLLALRHKLLRGDTALAPARQLTLGPLRPLDAWVCRGWGLSWRGCKFPFVPFGIHWAIVDRVRSIPIPRLGRRWEPVVLAQQMPNLATSQRRYPRSVHACLGAR